MRVSKNCFSCEDIWAWTYYRSVTAIFLLISANCQWRWMHRSATIRYDQDVLMWRQWSCILEFITMLSNNIVLCIHESEVFHSFISGFSSDWLGPGFSRGWFSTLTGEQRQSRAGRILHGMGLSGKGATRNFQSSQINRKNPPFSFLWD